MSIRSRSSNVCCHCLPFSHAEMAALKLITLIRLRNSNVCHHCLPFSHAEVAARKLITSICIHSSHGQIL
eukprot:10362777-Karenia_brevis.AAC.1